METFLQSKRNDLSFFTSYCFIPSNIKIYWKIDLNFKKYIKVKSGSVPIVLSCSHGGYKKPKSIPDKPKEFTKIKGDKNTLLLAKRLIFEFKKRNIEIYYIFSKIHRKKIDFNRPPRANIAFDQNCEEARRVHAYFHEQVQDLYRDCVRKFNKCLFVDFHGFTKPNKDYPDIIFGNLFGMTLHVIQNKINTNQNSIEYWGFYQLMKELSKDFTVDHGLGNTNFNDAYSGGYITHQFFQKEKCNALQLEVAKDIRLNFKLADKFIKDFVSAIILCLNE